jgi:hypothetical protein
MVIGWGTLPSIRSLSEGFQASCRFRLTASRFLRDDYGAWKLNASLTSEQLQEMFEAPDIRPLSASDISAANRRHDEKLAHSPWFQLWQRYGVCCRTESPVLRLGESES